MSWLYFVIYIGATWRITRFIVKDDLIRGTRERVLGWLRTFPDPPTDTRSFLADKLWTLLTCPWCVGIYASAGVLLGARIFAVDSIPLPIYTWLAVAAFQLVPYNYLDGGGLMRRFVLERAEDVSGVSGLGTVAEGVEFGDGYVVLRWIVGEHRSIVHWPGGIASVEAVNGHDGRTQVQFLDD